MRVASLVGARPQFVKLAPISAEFARAGVEHIVIHTGQHYDRTMSEEFFREFSLAPPDYNLGVGSGSHAIQTGKMLELIEPILLDSDPDWLLVYGDTNSTLAGVLASIKIGQPVAHLEAGLRSFNREMPEEHNRVLSDHASDLLLAPTEPAMENLRLEGLSERAVLVGDVMADVCLEMSESVAEDPPDPAILASEFVLATIHRPSNTDNPVRLRAILDQLASSSLPVLLPAHPRLVAQAKHAEVRLNRGAVRVVEPLGYRELVAAAKAARAIITDSGGLQKEAYLLGTPCTTVRTETEWGETLMGGWNVLCGEELDQILQRAMRQVPTAKRLPFYGTGYAAREVLNALNTRAT